MVWYVDTSALVKLVSAEAESDALVGWIRASSAALLTSDLSRAELMRATQRHSVDHVMQARALLDTLDIMTLSTATFELAGRLPPQGLRTLDALHLACAIELGDDLEAMVCYDERLTEAARANGLRTISPGVDSLPV